MTVIPHTFLKATSEKSSDVDMFKTIALLCGVGLLVSLLLTSGVAGSPLELPSDVMDWM